jgi:hypothetical protein
MLKRNPLLNKWLEDELHEMETSVGYDNPGQGQIVEYDPAFLSKFGWIVNLRGTVFSIPFIYWQFLVMLLFALAYAWAAGPMPAVIDVMGMPCLNISIHTHTYIYAYMLACMHAFVRRHTTTCTHAYLQP